jgi:hypothetical protein
MTQPSAAPFTCSVAWVGEVVHGDVNHPHINGMQGVRGSNPLSSTPGQRPSPPSTARELPASGSKSAAICSERPIQRPVRRCRRPAWLASPPGRPGRTGPRPAAQYGKVDRSPTGELTSSISGFCTRVCFRRISPESCTTMYRQRPLRTARSDGVWTKRGPGTSRSRGQRRSAHGGPCLARQTPPAAPDKRARPATASLGEPWRGLGQGHPPCRRAVPGQRQGGTPTP